MRGAPYDLRAAGSKALVVNVALVHDWLNQYGGAEDVLLELARLYPASPVYTSIYAPDLLPEAFRSLDVHTLWIDKLPGIHHKHQRYLPFYPLAWGGFCVPHGDVVVTNKSGFCHGLRLPHSALHVCYCLAPTRYVWQFDAYIAREGISSTTAAILRPFIAAMRRWDYAAAQRVHRFIAISTEIQTRIRTYYDRDSVVIYPPVDTQRFALARTDDIGDYYLIVSRQIPYKRIDLAVQACTRLGLKLIVGGSGRDLDRLRAMAGPTVEFRGFIPDDELPELMARCKAFLFPGLEDFGITPIQANAAGRPVIAFAGGGALDTVVPGITGEHFAEQTVDSLTAVLSSFDPSHYDSDVLQRYARQYDVGVFRHKFAEFVAQAWNYHRSAAYNQTR